MKQGIWISRIYILMGRKLEAYAKRYTFVWAKSIQKNKSQIAKQLEEQWSYAESVAKEELIDSSPSDFEQLEPKAVEKMIEAIDKAEIEVGLLALAHNFRKWAAILLDKLTKAPLFPIIHYQTVGG